MAAIDNPLAVEPYKGFFFQKYRGFGKEEAMAEREAKAGSVSVAGERSRRRWPRKATAAGGGGGDWDGAFPTRRPPWCLEPTQL
jgi:hypothetical protein